MTNNAIEHVKEAESTVGKVRQDAEERIKRIQLDKEAQVDEINKSLENEIRAFKKEQRQKFEENLEEKVINNKEEVKKEAEMYQSTYENKKDYLTSYVVGEVLKRYGNK